MIYEPAEDSYLLEKEVCLRAQGKRILDMGAGKGIQTIAALKAGALSVLSVDVNSNAIKELKKKGLNAIQSNLFSKVKGKFDLIIFNPPYLPEDKREDKESALSTSGGKKGDETIIRFLRGVRRHLADGGIILMVISSLTPHEGILSILREKGFKWNVAAQKNVFMERLEVWEISQSNKKL